MNQVLGANLQQLGAFVEQYSAFHRRQHSPLPG